MPSHGKRFLRDQVLPIAMATPVAQRRYSNRLSQLSHNYRGGPLAAPAGPTPRGGVAPGDRLPAVSGVRLGDKPVCTLDLLRPPAHTLLVLTGSRADHEAARKAIARLAPWAAIVNTIVISEEPLDSASVGDPGLRAHRRYGALTGQLLLVRPDGYLASRAPLDRPDIPGRYLGRLVPTSPRTVPRP